MLQTTNYNLKKIELNDSPPDITVINSNWDTIDVELKKAADLKAQYDALKIGTINLKNFTDFNKILVLDDTTEWEKTGSGTFALESGSIIPWVSKPVTVLKITNSANTQSYIGSGVHSKSYALSVKPDTEYTLTFLMKTSSISGNGSFGRLTKFNADGIEEGSISTSKINTESDYTQYSLTLKTSPNTRYIQLILAIEGIGSAWFYQPMLVEGNKIVRDWSPSLADIDRDINKKVDKVTGKGLSTNDYSNAEKQEVAKIPDIESHLGEMVKIKKGITVTSLGWIQNPVSQFWEYRINDNDITANTIVDVNVRLEDLNNAGYLKSANNSFEGYVMLYASEKPSYDLLCDLKLIRQVM